MKSTGIVRKIDSLGRLVIPKEIRDAEGWDEGQPMEMFMDDEGMVIRAYRTDADLTGELSHLISKLSNRTKISDEEKNLISIIAYAGQKNKSDAPTSDSKQV